MRVEEWPQNPSIYEINTWVWLSDLSAKYGAFVELGSVPSAEWDAISEYGFDAVWLMGVWERSPAGLQIANRNAGLLTDFRAALPDFHATDNVGSPYCVRRYAVDELLGGPEGLAAARKELADRGIRLILDFVPNHVAPDHPWAAKHPKYFIQGTAADLESDPSSYIKVGAEIFACGRDPYFPAWPDVLQLNAFHPGLRDAARATLEAIAAQCDAVRCDMAMLMENDIVERTWGWRAGERPASEYWAEIIPAIKQQHRNFLFMAEAYWDRESGLLQQGFDYCYDKRLYDRMEHGNAESIRQHLCADAGYQRKLVRFLENHDEPRAATAFATAKHKAVAVAMATLPGARLFHEGQFEGRKVRTPVFLGRRPAEGINRDLCTFYETLLRVVNTAMFNNGKWSLCARTGWPDNLTFENLLAWSWESNQQRSLVVVNLSDSRSQARIHMPWEVYSSETWDLDDELSGDSYRRDGGELQDLGLYVDLGPWSYHFFRCRRPHQVVFASAA